MSVPDGSPDRLQRMYAASSRISNAVVRSRSRQELLDAIPRILVEFGGFAMAYVAWYDAATCELTPVARSGDNTGYADRIRVFGDDRPEGRGPIGTAFRTGAPYVCNDFQSDPCTIPWRAAAQVSGWRATVAIPVMMNGMPCAILAIYSRESDCFGPAEMELVEQVLIDVSIGLERLDADEQRRRAEESLASSERRLKLALDAGGIGLWDYDMTTGRLIWDGHHRQIFGLSSGSYTGTYADFESRVHPDDLPLLNRAAAAALANRTLFSLEFRIVWPDGSVHWVASRGEYLFDGSDQPLRMRGAVLDMTERRRAEAALRESEERLRLAAHVANIGILDFNHIARSIHVSTEVSRIFGFSVDETPPPEAYFSRIHPDDRDSVVEAFRRAGDHDGDNLCELEHRVVRSDGSVRWLRARSRVYLEQHDGAWRTVRTIGAVQDITERKQAEEELRKLASLVEMSNDFIGIATLDGKVVYLNNAGMAMVGLDSLEEARSKNFSDFLPDDEKARSRASLRNALQKDGPWSREAKFRHFRTGELIDVAFTGFWIKNAAGVPEYVATVSRDITQQKKAEVDRSRLEERLHQAQKMESVGRLAGGVAHDFNNMLTVILGYVALAKSKALSSDLLSGYLDEIGNAANRSREITRQLLGFSRRQIIAPERLNLNALLADLRKPLARLIGEDIDFTTWPQEDLWAVALDSSQVNQILLNLVVNARDAMPRGGKLTIETANAEISAEYCRTQVECTPGQYVMIAVSDNGLGMSRETMSHLFEPFFTTKEAGRGTGLGLATVYGIVRQNGGFINVYSEPGRGTTFRIYFPRLVAQADAAASIAPVLPTSSSGNILLVEDDELVRNVTRAALESLGYTPLVASSAEEALRLCSKPEVALKLILTDVVMSGMTGVELRDRVRELRPDIRVLFMSGYTSNVIVTHGVLKKGVHFIQKPFTIEQLGLKITEVLGASTGASA